MSAPYDRQRELAQLRKKIAIFNKRAATARTRIGRKVTSVQQLAQIAEQKRSVYVAGSIGLRPASVVLCMQACWVLSAINSGRVHFYKAPKARK